MREVVRWVRVRELIVPVLKNRSLEKMVSYHIFREPAIDMETLLARLEPLTKGEKVAVHKYVRSMSRLGLVALSGEGKALTIHPLVPPIHVDVFKHALALQVERLGGEDAMAREMGVSIYTVRAWERGSVPRDSRILMKILEVKT